MQNKKLNNNQSQREQKSQPKSNPQPRKTASRDDFLLIYDGRYAEVHIAYGQSVLKLEGTLNTDARFNIILRTDENENLIINKAFIIAVKPL
ncbi:MAG: hypothetical protein ACP5H3_04125 [Candidatus Aenigmatarchaeota archaeon]